MKHISLIILAVLVLALLSFAHSRTLESKSETVISAPQTSDSTDQTLVTQQRLNRYFHSDVVPKLRKCWQGVQGEGTLETKITFIKARGSWIWQSVDVSSSTLPRGQDAVASRCLKDAIRGTSFSVTTDAGAASPNERVASKFVVNWNWPVPLPANSAEFRKRPGGTKTGGCDGAGSAAKCYTCSGGKCAKVCVGYDECTVNSQGQCYANGACASGGPFGGTGKVIIY